MSDSLLAIRPCISTDGCRAWEKEMKHFAFLAIVTLWVTPALAQLAKDNLQALGANNTTVVTGPLVGGWSAAAPYEVILLDGAVEDVPQALLRQLRDGGRLLGVVGRPPLSKAMLFRSTGSESSSRLIFDATAPALPGFAKPPAFVF